MPTTVRAAIAEIARAQRETHVQNTLLLWKGDRDATSSRRDAEQMIDGFLALLSEALQGDSREVRSFYLETVIPGLIASGAPAEGIVGGVVEFAVNISVDVVAALPPEQRAEGKAWFAHFFNEYVAQMVRVAVEASK